MTNSHPFNFAGGETLSQIGATWFVAYAYYKFVDSNYLKWKNVQTSIHRANLFAKSSSYWEFWLNQILLMNNKRLNTNSLKINAEETKQMAKIILAKLHSK
jgi:hypothetical protein